jgi:hypothetical protein
VHPPGENIYIYLCGPPPTRGPLGLRDRTPMLGGPPPPGFRVRAPESRPRGRGPLPPRLPPPPRRSRRPPTPARQLANPPAARPGARPSRPPLAPPITPRLPGATGARGGRSPGWDARAPGGPRRAGAADGRGPHGEGTRRVRAPGLARTPPAPPPAPPPASVITRSHRAHRSGEAPSRTRRARFAFLHTLRPPLGAILVQNSSVPKTQLEYGFFTTGLLWRRAVHDIFPVVSGPPN